MLEQKGFRDHLTGATWPLEFRHGGDEMDTLNTDFTHPNIVALMLIVTRLLNQRK